MPVRDQNCVRPAIAGGEMAQSIVDAGGVRLNAGTECYAQKTHAREIRIDEQGVITEFELVTVRAEISHAYAAMRSCPRIANNQVRIRSQSRTESLRGESEKKQKTAHPTTDNADVTDVEAKAGVRHKGSTNLLKPRPSRSVCSDSVCLTNSVQFVSFDKI